VPIRCGAIGDKPTYEKVGDLLFGVGDPMSRLYFFVETDAREKAVGVRAHGNAFISAKWGSRHNSQDLFTIRIDWPKDSEAPVVTLQKADRRADFTGFESL